MTEDRYKQAAGAWTGIGFQLALAVVKGVFGLAAQSKALLADALYTGAHAVGAIAAMNEGRTASSREASPISKSGLSPVATILLAVLFMVGSVEIAVTAVKSILQGVEHPPRMTALIIIVSSIIVQELWAQYQRRVASQTGGSQISPATLGRRGDLLASLAACIGISGSWAASYAGLPALYMLDPLAGIIIAASVMGRSYRLLLSGAQRTQPRTLHQEDAQDLLETVQRIKGVISIDDLQAKEEGHYVRVDVKISVNPRITIYEGHEIAKTVKQVLMKRFIHVTDVMVQVFPYDPGYPYKHGNVEHDDMPTLLH
ncbi:cation diffusion facilitator family transporter [Paenibacillus sp. UNCCL117]|uniref:cation diffusion facilitator family transporter n=1 Tax=unclassified Paenibacillus TaxID=185978 RepID=UPI0008813F27|nr:MULTISPECIES: cation diffusion facilitator family transporter [unclassified Paenibacillus]SDE60304.1 cation diffusion facilitator family transporter [Paenibacillus sp. cl123]SFW69501.1 cation diffusion facilitator family transporter [Paenibacillus sp. UNCCL117]